MSSSLARLRYPGSEAPQGDARAVPVRVSCASQPLAVASMVVENHRPYPGTDGQAVASPAAGRRDQACRHHPRARSPGQHGDRDWSREERELQEMLKQHPPGARQAPPESVYPGPQLRRRLSFPGVISSIVEDAKVAEESGPRPGPSRSGHSAVRSSSKARRRHEKPCEPLQPRPAGRPFSLTDSPSLPPTRQSSTRIQGICYSDPLQVNWSRRGASADSRASIPQPPPAHSPGASTRPGDCT